jgi:hypothetical protein
MQGALRTEKLTVGRKPEGEEEAGLSSLVEITPTSHDWCSDWSCLRRGKTSQEKLT